MVEGFPDLPSDAREVAQRSLACQHFWGEATGTGDERDQEVAAHLEELQCNRIEQDLDGIRAQYNTNPAVLRILEEAVIE